MAATTSETIELAARFAAVLARAGEDAAAVEALYQPGARSFGPLGWPVSGAGAIAERAARVAARLEGLEVALHDAFADGAGDRVALRIVRRFREGADRIAAIESRYLRIDGGLVAEEFVGPNTFQIADRELNRWGLAPADTIDDPAPEILSASPSEVSGKAPETIPERFVHAFGRNDPQGLLALYHPRFVLFSPIAWGLAGTGPLVPFVQQFHRGFPGLRLALFDQFASADGTRIAFRFGMRWHNTGTFFEHPPTGHRGSHEEFHSLRIEDGQIVEQVVTDISYGIPKYELTVWHRPYPAETEDPAPRIA
jgi:hypothetical protein